MASGETPLQLMENPKDDMLDGEGSRVKGKDWKTFFLVLDFETSSVHLPTSVSI